MPSAPIKIVFLTQDLCYGGTQRQIMELARRLDKKYFAPSIWTLTGATDLDSLALEYSIPVINLGKNTSPNISFILSLFKQLRLERPNILVPCTAMPNIWGRILGKARNIPVIIGTCRGGGAPKSQHEYFLWRLTKHMICNTKPLYEIISALGMPSEKITYIPNGVDSEFYEAAKIPLSQRPPLILSVGRLVDNKDYPTLLEAFKIVLETIPNAKLRIVGSGPHKLNMQKEISHTSFKNAVELIESSVDTRHHYQEAKIFALTSIVEGQPNVILEAMSSSLPIVATNVGGVPDMVQDRQTGFLSQKGDIRAIAQNICTLLNNEELCQTMGEAGRDRVINEFSFQKMVGTHQSVFEKLWQKYQSKQL